MKTLTSLFTFIIICLSAFSQAPTITSFSPISGPVGTLVTVKGTNLGNPLSFTIGGVSAIFISGSTDSIVGMVMPGAVNGGILLTTVGGNTTSTGNFVIRPTPYPSAQQGSKLVGQGADTTAVYRGAEQGYSVSISADGNTALIAGPSDSSGIGAVWVFVRSSGIWTQQGYKLRGSGYVGLSGQGNSVALSADGNTAIIGGPGDNNDTGAVWIFTRTNGVWSQQGNKLVGSGHVGSADQGNSVAISADGNTAIVGGSGDNNDTGAVWIFTRTAGVWTQQGNKLVGSVYVGPSDQGRSVAISADGNTAIIGGPGDNNDTGAVWIFTRTAGVWTQQGPKLIGTGAVNPGSAFQGISVALSADGNTAIEGSGQDSFGTGAVWVFVRSNGVWTQQGSKLVGSGNLMASQSKVSLSADGNTAIAGGPNDNRQIGAVWVYSRSGGIWTQQGPKLIGTGAIIDAISEGPFLGSSVSLSSDGSTAIAGGWWDNYDNSIGASWVFSQCNPDSSNIGYSICQRDSFSFGTRQLTTAGIYHDTLTNISGCDSIITLTLTVIPTSYDTFYHTMCQGDSFVFSNIEHHSAGIYYDTLSGVNSCDSILMLTLTVNPLPVVTFNQTDTAWEITSMPTPSLNGGSPSGGHYIGPFVTADSIVNVSFSIGYDTIFAITYSYTDSGGCTASASHLFKAYVVEGISDINDKLAIHLYPNPNKGSFTLQTSNKINSEYVISDMLGHIVSREFIRSDKQNIEMPDDAEGVYTLSLAGAVPVRFVVLR